MPIEIDQLAGQIALRRGPVMRGHAILTAAAARAGPEQAVAMLAEAVVACLYAGNTAEMLSVAERARAGLAPDASVRARFLAAGAIGMARILGGDGAAGAAAIHEAISHAESSSELRDDLRLQSWLAIGPICLREAGTGRSLLDYALKTVRERAAVGELPFILNLIARDEATTDRWAVAEATYREAIELARESDQQTALVFALSGLAWLQARRGREVECRALTAEALELSSHLGTKRHEVWTMAALGELELGLGDAARAANHFEDQQRLLRELGITDADLSPAPDLVDAYLRLGRTADAQQLAAEFSATATAKGQAWSLARALRSRARNRVLAREQLRAAIDTFERLDARPWFDRARAELAATGVTLRRRDPSTIDELTPQELQIAVLLAGGKTTRETATALFLSPKTIEYHLRHVYQTLTIHSREELGRTLAASLPDGPFAPSRSPPRAVDDVSGRM